MPKRRLLISGFDVVDIKPTESLHTDEVSIQLNDKTRLALQEAVRSATEWCAMLTFEIIASYGSIREAIPANLTTKGVPSTTAHRDLPFEDLAAYWRERWLLPRAGRVDRWRSWEPESLLARVFQASADSAPSEEG